MRARSILLSLVAIVERKNECVWLLSNTINSPFYLAYRVAKQQNTVQTKKLYILNVFPANMEIEYVL